jgi:7-keto-8-aminopelargonate synthetase-like enzyme/acyl-CoA synthetase (AMP-forming)/AMP-acid ligase II/pimeloyl-ACP methyl ester carboxylesterase/acyl carrier protein
MLQCIGRAIRKAPLNRTIAFNKPLLRPADADARRRKPTFIVIYRVRTGLGFALTGRNTSFRMEARTRPYSNQLRTGIEPKAYGPVGSKWASLGFMATLQPSHDPLNHIEPFAPTLGELLQHRASSNPDSQVFVWVDEAEAEHPLTFQELHGRALAIAARLSRERAPTRTLLLCPPGLDFICAFFACQLAGSAAVPAYAPNPKHLKRSLDRLLSIVSDCKIDGVLTCASMLPMVRSVLDSLPSLRGVELVAVDSIEPDEATGWNAVTSSPDDVAVIQYTSGSTSHPKGVVLDHRNVLMNAEVIRRVFDLGSHQHVAFWLPPYHDMGLFGGIVQPVYAGMPAHLMSPLDFLRHPRRWLSMISRCRATVSGGPNFAYDRVVRKADPERDHELDLSSWRIAFSGAEPVRNDTIQSFVKRFAQCGFDESAIFPVYGLAEATLLVTAPKVEDPPKCLNVSRRMLRQQGVAVPAGSQTPYSVMSCGRIIPGHRLEIVDPETGRPRSPGEVGEIWIEGPSVSRGYLDKPDENRQTFQATLSDGTGPFLRTGDLGFQIDGELFITGRRKDLIIVRGVNFHPQDIERVAEQAASELRQGCSAAFQVDGSDGDELVSLVVETSASTEELNPEDLCQRILTTVQERLELQLDLVVLAPAGSVPKTSSGKIQRQACADALAASRLSELARWTRPSIAKAKTSNGVPVPGHAPPPNASEVQQWLLDRIAASSAVRAGAVAADADFAHLGLDSVSVTDLIAELELWVGREIPESFLSEPSIAALAKRVAGFLASDPAQGPKPRAPRVNGTVVRRRARPALGPADRWSMDYEWEHLSPVSFLNAAGRDLFARTDRYMNFCKSVQIDQMYSFELNRIEQREGGLVLIETKDGERRWAVDLASHDYLGLTRHPEVIRATHEAIEEFGVGASGATLLNGNTPIHRALELELADWLHKEAVVLCPSGFSMMSAVTSGLLRPSDVVFFDEYSHASLLEGIKLSGARSIRFPHNDMQSLQRLLQRYRAESRGAMIVTDGVCSIDGSCAPVAELVAMAKNHEARLVIDDAHGIGTVGDGRGVTAGHDVDLVGGVLSKALGACGGFVAGERRVVEYIRFFGKSACATTNVSVANAAAALASLRLLRSEPSRVFELQQRVHRLRRGLRAEGVAVAETDAPIVSIVIGRDADAYRAWREALDLGVLAQALPFPIVPRDQARVRARVSHRLDPDLLDRAASALADASREVVSRVVLPASPPSRSVLGGFESRTASNGTRVHVRGGNAPWRVFLHPLLLSTEDAYGDVLRAYDTSNGVVAIDWWGHGDAGSAKDGGEPSLDDMADALATVLNEVGVPQACRFIGTSMGAMIAMRVAARHPEWVASTLLIGGSAEPEEGPSRRFFETLLDVAAELGTEFVVDDVLTSQLSDRFRGVQPERTQALLECLRSVDPAKAASCVRAVLTRPTAIDAAMSIQAPSVVMVGEGDLAEPVGHSERMAELIPTAVLEIIPSCGHLVPIERPDVVLDVLRRWDAADARLAERNEPLKIGVHALPA